MKYEPKVGDRLYLRVQTGDRWVDMVKDPATVIEVKGNTCIVQACELFFSGPRYYDTLPSYIMPDPDGKTLKLRWSEKKQRWQESPAGSYPRFAVFGEYAYQPYLN